MSFGTLHSVRCRALYKQESTATAAKLLFAALLVLNVYGCKQFDNDDDPLVDAPPTRAGGPATGSPVIEPDP